jgi:hypothetical protein
LNAYSLTAWASGLEISGQEEYEMHRTYRCLFSSVFLAAALAAPTAMIAATRPQDNGHQDDHHQNENGNHKVYDRNHKDYHNWDANEDRTYRQYLGEKHRDYRPFGDESQKQQSAYWNWRHSHPDNGHNGS